MSDIVKITIVVVGSLLCFGWGLLCAKKWPSLRLEKGDKS